MLILEFCLTQPSDRSQRSDGNPGLKFGDHFASLVNAAGSLFLNMKKHPSTIRQAAEKQSQVLWL